VYICICNAVKESHVQDAVAQDVHCFKQLSKSLGLCTDCGKCGRKAKDIFDEALIKKGVEPRSKVIPIRLLDTATVQQAC